MLNERIEAWLRDGSAADFDAIAGDYSLPEAVTCLMKRNPSLVAQAELAGRLAGLTGAPVDADRELIITPGTQGALFLAMGANIAPGDKVDMMGPLGRGFPLPPPDAMPLLVGGGYGVAPLYFLARTILAGGMQDIHLFVGGRTASDLLLLDEFRALGVAVHPATNDGSLGERGLVTVPLDAFLQTSGNPAFRPVLYACGPAPMLRALDERALACGFPAWLSLDRRMACGVGACCGCAQKVRDPDGAVRVAMVCSDGPVFPQGAIVWD